MLRKDIDKIFTDTIKIYLDDGFYIYSNTMGGHQGEIAKVDLFDGKNFRRVLMNSGSEYTTTDNNRRIDLEYISIIVGINTDKLYGTAHEIVWNEHLEILSVRKYYRIGETWNGNCFGSKEEAIIAKLKHYKRLSINPDALPYDKTIIFSDKAKKIVLSYMQRQKKCSSITLKQIDKVYKRISINRKTGKEKVYWCIEAKGQLYQIKNWKTNITNESF